MKRWILGISALALAAPGTVAAQRRGWSPADCKLSTSHYLLNSAVLYLRTAANTQFQDRVDDNLKQAHRVLIQAADQGIGENPALWYYLGRYYLEMHDYAGMDTAFAKAAVGAPDCREDIKLRRRNLWVPLLNRAVERIRATDNAAALEQLHQANAIYSAEPPAFYYIAQIYAGQRERDSAITYFKQALTIAGDSANRSNEQYQQIEADATFNVASLYLMQESTDSAVAWYKRFRALRPNDPVGITRQADALNAAGRTTEALALYDTVLMRADSMPTLDLFQAGVTMYQGQRYKRAAEAFEAGLRRNPSYRDALFNLANTYVSLARETDSLPAAQQKAAKASLAERMKPVVAHLVEVDPCNFQSQRLYAASFQMAGHDDSTLAALQRAQDLTFDVTVSRFAPAGSGFDVRGIISNRSTDKPVEVPALVFEFLDAQGTVVQSLTVEAQTIAAGEVAAFTLAPVGEGIIAWRYHRAP